MQKNQIIVTIFSSYLNITGRNTLFYHQVLSRLSEEPSVSGYVSLDSWLSLWEHGRSIPALKAIHADIVKRYREPQRHYHNLAHVSRCLEEFEEARKFAAHPFEVGVAVWFHDAVYDPVRHDNEEESATLARESLGGLLGEESMWLVTSLIMATKHAAPPATIDEKLIIDIDLSILGRPRREFLKYEEEVRKEYSTVQEERYKKGRIQILSRFLERPSIYYTDYFKAKYEKPAVENLRSSISNLKNQP